MNRVALGLLAVVMAGCGQPGEPETASTSCLDDLAAHRASLDEDFATDEYPLSDAQKAVFDGLAWFPPSPEFCVPASFAATDDSETFDMPAFNEKSIPFREYGVFEFQADGVGYSLTAYQRMDLEEADRQWVLVPFRDGTNGIDTYGGGRYLEIKLPIEARTEIDFNRAANPWCAYDPKYTCPVPPVENWLDLPVEAGEKNFPIKHVEAPAETL